MRFPATIRATGKNTTGIPVPEDVVAALGSGKRPAVRVTINGYTYRGTVAPWKGEYMLSVSAEVRERAGVAAGDGLDVDIEVDTQPRDVTMPEDFLQTLGPGSQAAQFFEGLSYSNKRRILLSIEGAKTEETRKRRIDKAVDALRDGRV